ncbi:MAG: hypothetical protein JNK82_31530 [Myxococcaceae bacterium]|nr:hypothetical protein [Myxococcaceae bacterium]
MRTSTVVLLALAVAACGASKKNVRTVPPDAPLPEVSQDVIEYDVRGSTSTELRGQLDALGPEDDSGRHDAYT